MLEWIKKLLPRGQEDLDFEAPPLFSEGETDYYLNEVFTRRITKNNLSIEYHYKVANHLENAMLEGFRSPGIRNVYEAPPIGEVINGLRRHIYIFSAAKQYSQVRELSAFIDDTGAYSTFKEFREIAGKIFETYNVNYLKAEYATAVGQCEMAKQWVEFQDTKETFPFLTYHTQEDARVRDEHAVLNGITLPVDDKFWSTYMPKNGWRCRCFVTQHDEAKVTDMSKRAIPEFGEKAFPKVFRMNPGKDQLIFNPKFHPYFRIAKGDADFKANNYNLPIP